MTQRSENGPAIPELSSLSKPKRPLSRLSKGEEHAKLENVCVANLVFPFKAHQTVI